MRPPIADAGDSFREFFDAFDQFFENLAAIQWGSLALAMLAFIGWVWMPNGDYAPIRETAEGAPPLVPNTGRPYNPVVTLNGWSLPWRMNNGWKEFHLVAEPVRRQLAPGMTANLWGYNGQSPGPTIECVEGDKVRIFVTNKLPEHTTIHWHGILLPNGMDGVGGLNQPTIKPGETFVYDSYCHLATLWGTMEGSYTFQDDTGERFPVAIPRFSSRRFAITVVAPRPGTPRPLAVRRVVRRVRTASRRARHKRATSS